MLVVLWPLIESHVKPRDTGAGGIKPYRFCIDPVQDRLADAAPERMLLRDGRIPVKIGQVRVLCIRRRRLGDDQIRVAAEIGEADDLAVRRSKVFRESTGVCWADETRAINEHALKYLIYGGRGDRRRFPTHGSEWSALQFGNEEFAKRRGVAQQFIHGLATERLRGITESDGYCSAVSLGRAIGLPDAGGCQLAIYA